MKNKKVAINSEAGSDQAMIRAAFDGDVARVEKYLSEGADPSAKWHGRTAFMAACFHGHADCAKALAAVSNLHVCLSAGQSLLSEALAKGHYAVADVFLELGMHGKLVQQRGATELMLSVAPETEAACAYLASKVDVNQRDINGCSALLFACSEGSPRIIEILLNAGADALATNCSGQSAIMYACAANSGERLRCVEMLIAAGGDPRSLDSQRRGALHIACENGDDRLVAILLSFRTVEDALADVENKASAAALAKDYDFFNLSAMIRAHDAMLIEASELGMDLPVAATPRKTKASL